MKYHNAGQAIRTPRYLYRLFFALSSFTMNLNEDRLRGVTGVKRCYLEGQAPRQGQNISKAMIRSSSLLCGEHARKSPISRPNVLDGP